MGPAGGTKKPQRGLERLGFAISPVAKPEAGLLMAGRLHFNAFPMDALQFGK
jgi:hypothetical protein